MTTEEKLKLAKESMWYIRWAITFSSTGIVVVTISFIELLKGNMLAVLLVDACVPIPLLISLYLSRKSRAYRHKAFGNEK